MTDAHSSAVTETRLEGGQPWPGTCVHAEVTLDESLGTLAAGMSLVTPPGFSFYQPAQRKVSAQDYRKAR